MSQNKQQAQKQPKPSKEGLWIPGDILEDTELTYEERLVLALIITLSFNKYRGCYATNEYLGSFIRISPRRCQQIIRSLKDKQRITAEQIDWYSELSPNRAQKVRCLKAVNFDAYVPSSTNLPNINEFTKYKQI